MTRGLQLTGLVPFPLVQPGDDVAGLILAALADACLELAAGDVLVVAQKIISKAEGRYVRLAQVQPSAEALELAARADKDPRLVELILRESRSVLRVRPGILIVEHRNGYVHANAGIDRSNIDQSPGEEQALLLPRDPDASAAALRSVLLQRTGVDVPVVINDSAGRAWRNGTVGMTLGCAGLEPLFNQIGEQDLFGNRLEVTEAAVADELAAAASLVMGQAAEACPVVLARGLSLARAEVGSDSLLRPRELDLFR
jgi:coenzyme F420-0:L-glutamate ligase/coenzyme F420-1:gamma-L-glutamate ligase